MPIDLDSRKEALTPDQSFIVTAPAGSGKTYLLTRRILSLLLTLESPYQLIAITFTKKAALEMKERVKLCLEENEEPLAISVLQRSIEKNWDILNNVDHLNIMTLDAFSSWLLSKGHPKMVPNISQNPYHIYQTVVFEYYKKHHSDAQIELLAAFSGQYSQLESLLCDLLSNRDQWQSTLDHQDLAMQCQQGIVDIIKNHLHDLKIKLQPIEAKITQLSTLHQKIAHSQGKDSLYDFSTPKERLISLAKLLFTSVGEYRKTLNKNQGIYAKSTASEETLMLQDQFKKLYFETQEFIEITHLKTTLFDTLKLPNPQTEKEASFLKTLNLVLNALVEKLDHYFSEKNLCDFIGISKLCGSSLEKDPQLRDFCTQEIHHLLVDEFQDTSQSQYKMLETIIETWPKGQKRTFFAVGDPMQSIYRFRQADLSLFIRLQSHPIAHIQPKSIVLQSNFRSSSVLIDKINILFKEAFPKEIQSRYSGIPYNPAVPTKNSHPFDNIYLHLEQSEESSAQATLVLKQILNLQASHPEDRIAVLVQARSHLKDIIPLLEQHNIPFNAIDLYPSLSLHSIQDLCALQSALIDPYDRLSFFILLRSPLCGLSLEELASIPQTMNTFEMLDLSINPYFEKFSKAFKESLKIPNPVQQTAYVWNYLQGDLLYPQSHAIAIENWFLQTLARYEENLALDRLSLLEHFSKSYNSILNPLAKLNLLTAHKSKGLEYEHVIIPHLEKRKPPATLPLFFLEHGEYPIIQPTFSENEQNIAYFKYLNLRKDQYENIRLFYVAATRAKSSLHLVAQDKDSAQSWLSAILPHLDKIPNIVINREKNEPYTISEKTTSLLRTLRTHPISLEKPKRIDNDSSKIGTALHYYMQIYTHPLRDKKWAYYCHSHGLKDLCPQKIQNTKTLQWIMQPHLWSRNEFALQYQHQHYTLDRVFKEDQTLWIIDYKFPTQFISDTDLLSRYQMQLSAYQKALTAYMPGYEVKAALYLPLEDRLILHAQDSMTTKKIDHSELHPS